MKGEQEARMVGSHPGYREGGKAHRKHKGGRKEGHRVEGVGLGWAPLASSVDCCLTSPHREENQTLTEARSFRPSVAS